jgi:hypothetical protein
MKDKGILVKVTEEQHALIKLKAEEFGFDNMSDYIRYLALNTKEVRTTIK